ncbi:hypothetical protein PF006_g32203, partial [Phytophthora fragariae]
QIAYGPGGRPASPGLGVAATHRLGSGAAQEHEGGADRGGTSLGGDGEQNNAVGLAAFGTCSSLALGNAVFDTIHGGGGGAQAALGGDAALGFGGAADSELLLLKQHLDIAATRLSASVVPTISELLLLKQHLDMAATRRSSTAVHADSVVELRKQHVAATRAWASEVPADSELLLLKQHLDIAATRLSASVVPINPVLAPL